jgi:methyltransferase (TIGR00027 family)
MEKGRPSRTAQRVALRRAAHQLLDAPLVFTDPLAVSIVGRDAVRLLEADPSHLDLTPFDRGLRAFAAARSRLVEDRLADAVRDGLSQFVVLGAGLDTFGYRNPYPGLRVFEVDHPDTHAWKRERLEEAGIAVPASVTYVAVDFATMDAFEALRAAGFRDDAPAGFSWLGVVTYLELEAVRATLRRIASLPCGSFVVFDYAIARELLSDGQRAVLDEAAARVAAIGEPFITFFRPDDLERELRAAGFTAVEQMGPDELNAGLFSGRTDGLRAGGMAWIACATV